MLSFNSAQKTGHKSVVKKRRKLPYFFLSIQSKIISMFIIPRFYFKIPFTYEGSLLLRSPYSAGLLTILIPRMLTEPSKADTVMSVVQPRKLGS